MAKTDTKVNHTSDRKATTPKVPEKYADESYKLFSKLVDVSEPPSEKARQIRNKCVRRVLPFLCIGYHLMYAAKQTVSPVYAVFSPVVEGSSVGTQLFSAPWKMRISTRHNIAGLCRSSILHIFSPNGRGTGPTTVPGGNMAGAESKDLVSSFSRGELILRLLIFQKGRYTVAPYSLRKFCIAFHWALLLGTG
jgi:hypothetical protein